MNIDPALSVADRTWLIPSFAVMADRLYLGM
jgi:hypothetical protein